ncbi:MAG: recombinase family protein, partial [Chloroflexi bacterium]|nr:recombinase family protein [Chloroflexota bacterium]
MAEALPKPRSGAMASDKAAIYARKSTGKETDNRSIDEQLKACRQYAEEQGWKVEERHVFTEIHSGKSVFDRPKMKTLLTAMTNGEVNRIICYHRDRRARNMKESGWLDTEAMRHDATWHFVNSGMVPEGIEDADDRDHMAGMEDYFSVKE